MNNVSSVLLIKKVLRNNRKYMSRSCLQYVLYDYGTDFSISVMIMKPLNKCTESNENRLIP